MVTNAPPRLPADAPASGDDVEVALQLWRAFSALVNARRAVRSAPSEGTILALSAAQTAWSRAQAELRAAVPPDPPA